MCCCAETNILKPIPITTTLRTEDNNKRSPPLAFKDKNGKKIESSLRASEVNTKAPFNINAKKRFFTIKSMTKVDL